MAVPNSYTDKLAQLKQRMDGAKSVLILAHDFPDPDCLASAFGLQHLLAFWGISSSTISFGGFVGRAENRAMVRFARIDSVPFMLVDLEDYDRIALVDSFPGLGNLSLPKEVTVTAVLDHHPNKAPADAPYFWDIRKDMGATSTMVTKYLLEAGCPLTPNLATALFYGIKTDTNEMARNASPEDLECYKFLFDKADHHMLSKIEWPERDPEYFRILHTAAEVMVTFGSVGYTHLGHVSTPDHIAEIADLFDSLQTIKTMVCSGVFKNQIYYSIRSKDLENTDYAAGDAAERIARTFGGSGGGHSNMAAGRIPLKGKLPEDMTEKLTATVRQIYGTGDTGEGQRLLPNRK
jgi:nanoRNase/pAp phosphatase (c-di-AMP/oligoRNAs hydrolase)